MNPTMASIAAPDAFLGLFKRKYFGKQLVKLF